jgi:hypothetical protein
MKTLVLYVFHEYHERVQEYIQKAIFLDPDIDFLIINNGSSIEPPTLPDYVIYFKGPNLGYDFGGWSRGLLYNDLYKGYDRFIFVNSSVMGPYLPSYFKGKWTDIYLDGLTSSIRLFGSTINTGSIDIPNDPEKYSHIQSYIFSTDLEGLKYLISKEIFSLTNYSKTLMEAVLEKEVRMSRLIIENGWNIGCLMTYYKGVDFRFLASKPSDYKPFLGEVMNTKHFSNKLFNNFYELVFIKGNRFNFNVQGIKL